MGRRPPRGYAVYDPTNFNHTRYTQKIHLYKGEFPDVPVYPHYVKFEHHYDDNQHYAYGIRDDADPPEVAYGWPIEAAPFIGPNLPTNGVDNEALGVFDASYDDSIKVDIAVYALKDYGVTADVDRYRGHMLDYDDLLARKRQLDKELIGWRSKYQPIRNRLVSAQARNRIHPYLHGLAPIPAPPLYGYEKNPDPTVPHFLTMEEAIELDARSGVEEPHRPWYHDSHDRRHVWGSSFPRCTYCQAREHTYANCPTPHARCHTTISCIIPTHHRRFGPNCPAADLHLTIDDTDVVIEAIQSNLDSGEGYVGLEENDGEA